ncbi:hypothetical protein DPMN_045419 [Dreissena polymorpha]|uniref:Uncharacterized protein n=1 Tax=Dreissena polymorpha TaxID=45954 RepID=A0A9D4I1D5_DREPO|nr:hypothetical protein DPMN_045419 [Dreissena polymorpha]
MHPSSLHPSLHVIENESPFTFIKKIDSSPTRLTHEDLIDQFTRDVTSKFLPSSGYAGEIKRS